ncbi:hypothetical protein TWF730_010049 [Orbilia blumenaviensis]|uniref:Uncharacterized protein n=1 Tax=Orbilia blumenaviensis TaxID=1796055 RepID=A0AAV9UUJ4_9PEZI
MRLPVTGRYLFIGLVGQLAIVHPVYGIANVPKDVYDKLVEQQGTKSAFTDLGTALGELVTGVLSNTGTGGQTLPTIVDRFTTKLKIAATTLSQANPSTLSQYGFTDPTRAKAAASALMSYSGYIAELPHTPVLPDFSNQLVPIPQDFWNPDDPAPEMYSDTKPAEIFPLLEKFARYVDNQGVELTNYRSLIQWLFAARYNPAQQTEDLNMEFFDQFMDRMRALSSNVQDVLQQYVNIWFEINGQYTFGGGLDVDFYNDQRELQAYLETRAAELKEVMAALWECHGFIGMVRIYEPYVEPPKREKKKGKGKKDPAGTW